VVCGWEYFPNHKGLVSGVVIGAFGFGSFIFNLVSTALINPNNIPDEEGLFPREVYENVPRALRIMLGCWTGLSVIWLLTISRPSKQEVDNSGEGSNAELRVRLTRENINSSNLTTGISTDTESPQIENHIKEQELSFKECLKSSQFSLLFIMMYLSIFYGYFIANVYKDFGELYIKDDRFLTLIGALSAAWAGFRFIWSFMMQKLSFKMVYSIMLVLQILVAVTINWSVRNRYSYLVSICLTIWIEGGHFTTLPTVCGKLYGMKGTQVFTIIFWSFGLSSMSGVFVVKVLLHRVFGFSTMFFIWAGMTAISLIILLTFFREDSLIEKHKIESKMRIKSIQSDSIEVKI